RHKDRKNQYWSVSITTHRVKHSGIRKHLVKDLSVLLVQSFLNVFHMFLSISVAIRYEGTVRPVISLS
ncbi:MAG: hypothetical protein WCE92_02370, partial [Nitrososphaeraceae archaeon]